MKKSFFATILVMVFALVATTSMSARQNNSVNASDFNACRDYLVANPADTIVNETVVDANNIVRRLVFLGTDGRIKAREDKVQTVINHAPAQKELAATSRKFEESLALDRAYANEHRDYEYAHSDEVEDYARANGVTHVNAGKGVLKARDNQGLAVRAGAGVALTDGDMISPEFFLGGSYSFRELLKFYLTANVGQAKYGSELYADQRYWSYGYEARAAFKLFQFDNKSFHNRFYVTGGIRQMWQKVGEEESIVAGRYSVIDSWGNNLSWVAGVSYELSPKLLGYGVEFTAQYIGSFNGRLNTSSKRSGTFMFSAAFELELLRNAVSLK